MLRALHDARRKPNPVGTLHPQPTPPPEPWPLKKACKAGPGQGCSGALRAEVVAGPIAGVSVGSWWSWSSIWTAGVKRGVTVRVLLPRTAGTEEPGRVGGRGL